MINVLSFWHCCVVWTRCELCTHPILLVCLHEWAWEVCSSHLITLSRLCILSGIAVVIALTYSRSLACTV